MLLLVAMVLAAAFFFGCFLGRLGVILIMSAPQGGAVTVGLSPASVGLSFSPWDSCSISF
jgi:hypothetical protein